MRKKLLLLAVLVLSCLLPLAALAAQDAPAYTKGKLRVHSAYDSKTLKYTIYKQSICRTVCFVTRVWTAEPARQIKKAISPWKKSIWKAMTLAEKIDGAALVINGSGYVSKTYPWIPEDYPGTNEDYYCTPLGSITVVDGQVYRNLEGVPFYGLTLEEDGLHMYVGADNEAVLDRHPIQTWSFYDGCPMAQDGKDILDHEWAFAKRKAMRTVIARLKEDNTYLILTVPKPGLTLLQVNAYLLGEYDTEWIYDLDGGPSSALISRLPGKKTLRNVHQGTQSIVDVMGFIE